MLLFFILLSIGIGHLVFLLNKTDFLTEYGGLLGLNRFLQKDAYAKWKVDNKLEHGYPMFIREKYHTFWSKLFGCPFCLGTFLSVFLGLCYGIVTVCYGGWVFLLGLPVYLLLGVAFGGVACVTFLLESYFYKELFE